MDNMNRNTSLARRVHEIRHYLYGENGLEGLARALGVPVPTWLNYERGVSMPAEVLLDFMEVTGVDPRWLRTGEGDRLIGGSCDWWNDRLSESDLTTR